MLTAQNQVAYTHNNEQDESLRVQLSFQGLPGLVREQQDCGEFQPHPGYCGVKPRQPPLHPFFLLINTSVFQLPSLPSLPADPFKLPETGYCSVVDKCEKVLQDWINVLANRLNIFSWVSCRFASTNRVLPPRPHWPETLLISNTVSRAAPYSSSPSLCCQEFLDQCTAVQSSLE